jgi:hypothetical protein
MDWVNLVLSVYIRNLREIIVCLVRKNNNLPAFVGRGSSGVLNSLASLNPFHAELNPFNKFI